MPDPTGHVASIHPAEAFASSSIPFVFYATCSCNRLPIARNAIKWVLLQIQDHYAEAGLTGAVGNLTDGHLVRAEIAERIEAAPHPCQEPDGAYCACADLQRKQAAAIARGDDD